MEASRSGCTLSSSSAELWSKSKMKSFSRCICLHLGIDKTLRIAYSIPMMLPFRKNRNFTGRGQELAKIHEVFQDASSDRIVILYGLGGIGKTQIAAQYAYSYQKHYTSVWWADASTTTTLSNDFVNIAQKLVKNHAQSQSKSGQTPDYCQIAVALGLPLTVVGQSGQLTCSESGKDINIIISAVQSWLVAEGNQQWLLIIDNYDDLESVAIKNFLPTNASGSVLITSRAPDSRCLGIGIEVAEVGEVDAMEILRKSAHREIPDLGRGNEYQSISLVQADLLF